jgi:histidinol-phosphate aminotransferase
MDNITITPRAIVNDLHSFSPTLPDRTIEELREILGLDEVIKLSFNESPYGPSPRAISAVQQAVANVSLYHDPQGKELRQKLAALYAVDAAQIVLGNGADDIITLLAQALLTPGDNVVIPTPTFGQYTFATRLMEAKPVLVPVATDMGIDLAAMAHAINDRTKMVVICNPNNPTGMILSSRALRQFLQAVPREVVVVLDEAYAEYVTDTDYLSGLSLLSEFANVIVVRTFSKIYGMAALRLGYGIGHPWLIELTNRVRNLFNVNYLAQVAASAALDDAAFRDYVLRLNTAQRYRVIDALNKLGAKVYPSQTNFVLADFGAAAAVYYTELAKRGIIVRLGDGWNLPHCLRISLGDSLQNDKLIAAMHEIRRQENI